MEFGSKFVYDYTDSEEECVSDDELQEGMSRALSDGAASDNEQEDASLGRITTDCDMDMDMAGGCIPVPPPPLPPSKTKSEKRSSGIFSKLFGSQSSASSAPDPPPPRNLFSSRTEIGPRYTDCPVERSRSERRSKTEIYPKKKKHHWQLFGRGKAKSEVNSATDQQNVQGKRWRRADTNVINIKFNQLTAPPNMHTGDAVNCEGCEAILSHLSVVKQDEDKQTWTCEFCGRCNEVDLIDEEIPRSDDVTFMLQPAASTTASGRSGTDESLVVFVIDTSGSMCVTTEVPGTVRMRGDRLASMQALNDTGESQYIPGQRRNVTYVSRLQSVQAAVDHQLGELAKDHPNRRVGLIAFSSDVKVIGDGSGEPIHLSGDKLGNRAELIKAGSELSLPQPVKHSRHVLGDKVFDLEEAGQTALGPALLVAVSTACQVPGSKVIMCTDGLANVGLGNLDVEASSEAYDTAATFFDEVSSMASEKGVSVSVISIKGTDCKMVELGKISNETGGSVNIVDPLKLTEEFGSILADPIIATNVVAKVLVHKRLYIRNETGKESRSVRTVGNVTKSSEVTFEYGKRRHEKKNKKPKVDKPVQEEPLYDNPTDSKDNKPKESESLDNDVPATVVTDVDTENGAEAAVAAVPIAGADQPPELLSTSSPGAEKRPSDTAVEDEEDDDLKELPFQVQITYTDLEGAQAMRLVTQKRPVTKDRNIAEREMNAAAIGAHAAQQSAAMALEGEYTTSRLNAFMYQRLLARNVYQNEDVGCVYDNYIDNVGRVENRLNQMQQREQRTFGRTHSDEEMSDEEEEQAAMARARSLRPNMTEPPLSKSRPSGRYKSKKSVNRWHTCQDEEASDLYSNAKLSTTIMKKKK